MYLRSIHLRLRHFLLQLQFPIKLVLKTAKYFATYMVLFLWAITCKGESQGVTYFPRAIIQFRFNSFQSLIKCTMMRFWRRRQHCNTLMKPIDHILRSKVNFNLSILLKPVHFSITIFLFFIGQWIYVLKVFLFV